VSNQASNFSTSASILAAMPDSVRARRMSSRCVVKYSPSASSTFPAIPSASTAAAASSRWRERDSESHNQPDLFAGTEEKPPLFGYTYEDYMLEIRRPEIQKLLKKVQDATEFPW